MGGFFSVIPPFFVDEGCFDAGIFAVESFLVVPRNEKNTNIGHTAEIPTFIYI